MRYASEVARGINSGQGSCGIDDWRVRKSYIIVISCLYLREELVRVHMIMFSPKLMIALFLGGIN